MKKRQILLFTFLLSLQGGMAISASPDESDLPLNEGQDTKSDTT